MIGKSAETNRVPPVVAAADHTAPTSRQLPPVGGTGQGGVPPPGGVSGTGEPDPRQPVGPPTPHGAAEMGTTGDNRTPPGPFQQPGARDMAAEGAMVDPVHTHDVPPLRPVPPVIQRALPAGRPPIPAGPVPGVTPIHDFLAGHATEVPDIPGVTMSSPTAEVNTADRAPGNIHPPVSPVHAAARTATTPLAQGRTPHPHLPHGAPPKAPVSGVHNGVVAPLYPDGEHGVLVKLHEPGSIAESVNLATKGNTPISGHFALADAGDPQWKVVADTAKKAGANADQTRLAIEQAMKSAGYDGYRSPISKDQAFVFSSAKATPPDVAAAPGSPTTAATTATTIPAPKSPRPVGSPSGVSDTAPTRREQNIPAKKDQPIYQRGNAELSLSGSPAETGIRQSIESTKTHLGSLKRIINDPVSTPEEKKIAQDQHDHHTKTLSALNRLLNKK